MVRNFHILSVKPQDFPTLTFTRVLWATLLLGVPYTLSGRKTTTIYVDRTESIVN